MFIVGAAGAALRHKSMKSTLDVYKKQITPAGVQGWDELLEAVANKSKS